MGGGIGLGENLYVLAGVDINKGNLFAEMIKERVSAAWPEMGQEIGGFAGGGPIPQGATSVKGSADGAGTVALLSALAGKYTIGHNAVAMGAVDTYVAGARPRYLLDTLNVGRLVPDVHIKIIDSVIEACQKAGCRLIGGETAEVPDMHRYDWVFNLDVAVIGFPDPELIYVPVHPGQKVYGWMSYGPGSNGFSIFRKVHKLKIEEGFWFHIRQAFGLANKNLIRVKERLTAPLNELYGHSLAEDLLIPTPIRIQEMDFQRKRGVRFAADAHITGGGMPGNIPRVLPDNCMVIIDRSTWNRPTIFRYTQEIGRIEQAEMDKVFNQGIMVASIVDPNGPLPDDSSVVEIGAVEKRRGNEAQVQFTGKHRDF